MKTRNRFALYSITLNYKFYVVLFFSILLFNNSVRAQNIFVFKSLDQIVLTMWVDTEQTQDDLIQLASKLKKEWGSVKEKIHQLDILHFDGDRFVDKSESRIQTLEAFLLSDRPELSESIFFQILKEFKDIRIHYTNDEYDLDYIIEAYETYLSVHSIVHDQMMSLYEWNEFTWFVEDLKCKVDVMQYELNQVRSDNNSEVMKGAIVRLKQCMTHLEESLGEAFRPDFELPCDDLEIAFKDLFRAYLKRG